MVEQSYSKDTFRKFQEGTLRNLQENPKYMSTETWNGKKMALKVTGYPHGKITEGEVSHDPYTPQHTIRSFLGPFIYNETLKNYVGRPLGWSVADWLGWSWSLLPFTGDFESQDSNIHKLPHTHKDGDLSWNENQVFLDLAMGYGAPQEKIVDEGKTKLTLKSVPLYLHPITKEYEPINDISCQIDTMFKREFNGPAEDIYISLTDKNTKPYKKIARITNKKYKRIFPLGALLEGSLEGTKIEKFAKPLYNVPSAFILAPPLFLTTFMPGFEINSGYKVTVGENDEHTIYESSSEYLRIPQIIGRTRSHVKLYDEKYKIDIIPEYAFWNTLHSVINPKYLIGNYIHKNISGKPTGVSGLRHTGNGSRLNILKGVKLDYNGRGGKIKIPDEIIYPEVPYIFERYSPESKYFFLNYSDIADDSDTQIKLAERLEENYPEMAFFEGTRYLHDTDNGIRIEGRNIKKNKKGNTTEDKWIPFGKLNIENSTVSFRPERGLSKYLPKWMQNPDTILGKVDDDLGIHSNEQEIGRIILKRTFDDSTAARLVPEERHRKNRKTGQMETYYVDVLKADNEKVVAEYSANLFYDDKIRNAPELMAAIVGLLGHEQEKLNFHETPLNGFNEYSIPTELEGLLDNTVLGRNPNWFENIICRGIGPDLTPQKIYYGAKDLFGIEPSEEFIEEYILWDKDVSTKMNGQMSLLHF